MIRQYSAMDKDGYSWDLRDAIVMGYDDRPMILLTGRGSYQMPPEVFEMLALEYLSAHGYVILSRERIEEAIVREVHNRQEKR